MKISRFEQISIEIIIYTLITVFIVGIVLLPNILFFMSMSIFHLFFYDNSYWSYIKDGYLLFIPIFIMLIMSGIALLVLLLEQ